MNEAPSFERRQYRPHAPLPPATNPYLACTHRQSYCTICAREGHLLQRNVDIERSSWWALAPGGAA